jgi:hypothetical protein
MGKYPKFLIAKNPMADPEGVYIYHSRKPRFLAKVEGNLFEIIDDIDNMIEYYFGNVDKINGLISRMNDWYKSYKIHKNGDR